MKLIEFEDLHNVYLINKKHSPLMRLCGLFSKRFATDFWTTYRLPFCKGVIAYPVDVENPMLERYRGIRTHELVHVEQQASTFGLILSALLVSVFPLPVLYSGRWLLERRAYLGDIKTKRLSIDDVVTILWNGYGWPWPRDKMRAWFEKELANDENKKRNT